MNALEVYHLHFRYQKTIALADVCLTLPAGKILGLLGPNGSGKSTLLQIASTLLAPQQGTLHIFGKDVVNQRAAVRQDISVVFQKPSVDVHLSVLENMRHQGHLYGLQGAVLEQRLAYLMKKFDIASRQHDRVKTLSGGYIRRVDVAKALLHQPKLLILDEPSNGLDFQARRELWYILNNLVREEHMTILLATHLIEEADHCSDIALMAAGHLVTMKPLHELREEAGQPFISIELINSEPKVTDELLQTLKNRYANAVVSFINRLIRIQSTNLEPLVADLMKSFSGQFLSIKYENPTLEDIFLAKTGLTLSDDHS